jgi:hypothetical protein
MWTCGTFRALLLRSWIERGAYDVIGESEAAADAVLVSERARAVLVEVELAVLKIAHDKAGSPAVQVAEDRVAVKWEWTPNDLASWVAATVNPQSRCRAREGVDGDEVTPGVDVKTAVIGILPAARDLA